jgi:LemA protein
MFLALTIVSLCLIGFFIYNGLIGKKNSVENAMGGLDAELKKRYDPIPNLVATVKQYMQHEASTLEKIVELRGKALDQNLSQAEKQDVNAKISQSLSGIMVQMENYPQLKSNTNFLQLQSTLSDVENNISASRRFFNATVTEYNNALEMFPSNLVAHFMKLQRKEVFNIPEIERQNVSVKNLFEGKAS